MAIETILNNLAKSLPPIIARTEVDKITGGLLSSRTVANLDCLGKGPGGRVKFKKKVAYEKDAFLTWLGEHLKEADNA